MTKICHVTHLHPSTDTRIFIRECISLAKAGYDTYLVAPGDSREDRGVHVIGCGESPKTRWGRFLSYRWKVCRKALEVDAEIYHLHDPLLLSFGLKLKRLGKKVIFDSHEDVPQQTMNKSYAPHWILWTVSKLWYAYESYACPKFDGVVTATPYIAEQFRTRAKRVVNVNNFPSLDDIVFHDTDFREREPIVCYVGGVSKIRGVYEMVEAMEGVDGKMIIAGPLEPGLDDLTRSNVETVGLLRRGGVNELLGRSVAGLVLYLPIPNRKGSQPNKLFEYMAAGLPVICSDEPLWVEEVESVNAGICVNPEDVNAIRAAIVKLLTDRELAQQMGRNGRHAVETKYSWAREAEKLIDFYREVDAH